MRDRRLVLEREVLGQTVRLPQTANSGPLLPVARVIRNSSGNPILICSGAIRTLTCRKAQEPVQVDTQRMTFDFMKVTVNVPPRSRLAGDGEAHA